MVRCRPGTGNLRGHQVPDLRSTIALRTMSQRVRDDSRVYLPLAFFTTNCTASEVPSDRTSTTGTLAPIFIFAPSHIR